MDVTAFGAVPPEPLNSLDSAGVGLLQRVSARETLLGLRTVRQVGGMPFVLLRLRAVPGYKMTLKRVFDVVLVLVFAPLWVPLLAFLAVYVLVTAGRPVFYRLSRVGRDGVVLSCVKFRTMVPDAESDGLARLAPKDDQAPGLTGLAQVHGRYGTAPEYKLGYDLQYLVNWSIVINIQILFRTVWVVVSRRV